MRNFAAVLICSAAGNIARSSEACATRRSNSNLHRRTNSNLHWVDGEHESVNSGGDESLEERRQWRRSIKRQLQRCGGAEASGSIAFSIATPWGRLDDERASRRNSMQRLWSCSGRHNEH